MQGQSGRLQRHGRLDGGSAQYEYWLEPATPCTTSLIVGELALMSYLPQPIYESASYTSQVLGEIPAETLFEVVDGPMCDWANGDIWVQVQYEGLTGWLQEMIPNEGPYGDSVVPAAHAEPRSVPTITPQPGVNPLLPSLPIEITLAPNAIMTSNAAQVSTTQIIGDGLIGGFLWSPDSRQITLRGTLGMCVQHS